MGEIASIVLVDPTDDRDKEEGYQTLYTALVTLSQVMAPVMPFLSEAMYQNLVASGAGDAASVHHCKYPDSDSSLVDASLSEEMEALLRGTAANASRCPAQRIE